MKKTAIMSIAIATSAAIVMSGCATGESAPVDGKTISVLSAFTEAAPQFAAQAELIAKFEKDTGIKVDLVTAGENIADEFEAAQFGGKAPDVVITNLVEKSVDWVKNGAAVPVDSYIADWGLTDRLNPAAVDEWRDADGQAQGFPYLGFVWPVWYNMDLLEQAGVDSIPTTTDELISASDTLNAAGIAPLIVGGNDWSGQKLFLQFMQSYATVDEVKDVLGNGGYCASADVMKGIELFAKLRDAGVFIADVEGYTADQMNSTFYAGGAAIMSAGSWAFASVPEGLNIQLGGLPVPSGSSFSDPTAMQGYTATGIFVSAEGAKNIDAVKQFVLAWYEPEVAGEMAEVGSYTTAATSDEPITITNVLLAAAVNDLPSKVDFALLPDTYIPGGLADAMIRQTSAAYAKGTTPDAICSGLDSLY